MRLLLDSSAVIVLAGRTIDKRALEGVGLSENGVDYAALSAVSLDELMRSVPLAKSASERARRLALVERLSTGMDVLPVDLLVVRLHVELWRPERFKSSRPAKREEKQGAAAVVAGWVAATALVHHLEVLTAQASLYEGMKGLSVRSLK
ncbi:MAG: hypothetical protein ACFCUX_10145 [Candidatus Methylacidiphilales bacterium]